MGAHPWIYFVPHQANVGKAMLELREREFQAGRYNPAVAFPDLNAAAPGAQHASIDEAREEADADGTRSILDIDGVTDAPPDPDNPSFGVISKLPDAVLQELYDTTQPSRQMLNDLAFFEDVERGEICFAGYSYD